MTHNNERRFFIREALLYVYGESTNKQLAAFRGHQYNGNIRCEPQKVGGNNVYYQSTLDEFKRLHLSKDMTIPEAADYLGVNKSTIIFHYSTTGILKSSGKRSRALTFSKIDIDNLGEYIESAARLKEEARAARAARRLAEEEDRDARRAKRRAAKNDTARVAV